MTQGTNETEVQDPPEEVIETTKQRALVKLKAILDNDNITRGEMFDQMVEIVQILDKNTADIQVQRMYRFESDRPLKAFSDIIINDALLIKGIKVLEGKQGLFVSMPQEQAKDKKWYDSVRCLTQEIRDQITEVVLSVYNEG